MSLRNDRIATVLLSWVAGYADTAGFLKLNGLFTAHVTGNLIIAGSEMAGSGGDGVWVRLAVVLVFMAAVVFTTIATRIYRPRLSILLGFETATLLLFALVGILEFPNLSAIVTPTKMLIVGSAGVFAMGVQNALMRESLGTLAQTTVMTGNLTQFTIDILRRFWLRDYQRLESASTQEHEIDQRIRKFGGALFGFVLGAACGAFFMKTIGFWAILLPSGAIAALAFDVQRRESLSSEHSQLS